MDYFEFEKSIKSGKFAPVFLFIGEEDYLREEAVRLIISRGIDPETTDFNLDILYGNETDGTKILQIASSYPFMGERRLVIVKDLQRMKPGCIETINRYIKKPSPTTCLVLTATSLNFRLKHNKALKQLATIVEFKPLYDRNIPGWLKKYLKRKHYEITDEAIRILHENVGNSLRFLVNELEKVFLNIENRKQITADDIRHVVGLSRGFSVFELSDFIGKKDIKSALLTTSRMLELGESPIGILTMLTRYFGILLKVKHCKNAGLPPSQMASVAGVPPYFLKDYLAQAGNFPTKQIQKSFHLLLQTDIDLKTSAQKPQLLFELLMYNLIKT